MKRESNYCTNFTFLLRIVIALEIIYFLYLGNFEECLYGSLTLVTTFIVTFVYRFLSLNPPNIIKFCVQFFIFLSMFLGNMNKIYFVIPNWDDILHITSGFLLAFISYLVLLTFDNGSGNIIKNKSFVCFFIIIFGIASAGVWEMFEFTTDSLFGLQSQGGSLSDTMFDIINGTIGPVVISCIYRVKPNIFRY